MCVSSMSGFLFPSIFLLINFITNTDFNLYPEYCRKLHSRIVRAFNTPTASLAKWMCRVWHRSAFDGETLLLDCIWWWGSNCREFGVILQYIALNSSEPNRWTRQIHPVVDEINFCNLLPSLVIGLNPEKGALGCVMVSMLK